MLSSTSSFGYTAYPLPPPSPCINLAESTIDSDSLRIDLSVLVDSPQLANDRFGSRSISENEIRGVDFGILDEGNVALSSDHIDRDVEIKRHTQAVS